MLLKPYIKQYPKVIGLGATSILVRYANTLAFDKARVGVKGVINEDTRRVGLHHLNVLSKSLTENHWANYLNYKITHLMNYYLQETKLKIYYPKIEHVNQLDVLKYEKSYHYDFHVDEITSPKRVLSAIIFLNNDYTGGSLVFKNTFDEEQFEVNPIPGSIVIWPSNILFPHAVKPVEKGVRFSIVAWAA